LWYFSLNFSVLCIRGLILIFQYLAFFTLVNREKIIFNFEWCSNKTSLNWALIRFESSPPPLSLVISPFSPKNIEKIFEYKSTSINDLINIVFGFEQLCERKSWYFIVLMINPFVACYAMRHAGIFTDIRLRLGFTNKKFCFIMFLKWWR
jgi:hypothetical protein